ncbi:MAG: hypothetical protein AB7O67_10120 [Vicinamibacterales bacterium]
MASAYVFSPDPVARIRSEFSEMPGMRLTVPQAARLFGLTTVDCRRALAVLVRRRFLVRDASGQFHRPGLVAASPEGLPLPRPDRQRLASARLRSHTDRRARA